MQKPSAAMNFPMLNESTVELTSKLGKEYQITASITDDMDRVHYGQAINANQQRMNCCCANSAHDYLKNPAYILHILNCESC